MKGGRWKPRTKILKIEKEYQNLELKFLASTFHLYEITYFQIRIVKINHYS